MRFTLFILFVIVILNICESSASPIVEENSNNTETQLPIRRKRYEYLWFCVEIHVDGEGEFRIEQADLIWGKWIREPGYNVHEVRSPAGDTISEDNGRKVICSCGRADSPSGTEARLQITSHTLHTPWVIKWDRSYLKIPTKLIDWEDYDHERMYVDHQEREEYWHKFQISLYEHSYDFNSY